MLSGPDRLRVLSKFMCLILRHKPQNFGLRPDQYGFVPFESLLNVLKDRYGNVESLDIETIVRNCPKRRFEIKDKNIRATYGHSIDVRLETESSRPPEVLYHGTSPSMKKAILVGGLKPMKRRYVHLSKTKEEAFQVGRRKSKNPTIFVVKAKEAHQKGVKFYDIGAVVLTEGVSAEFVQTADES